MDVAGDLFRRMLVSTKTVRQRDGAFGSPLQVRGFAQGGDPLTRGYHAAGVYSDRELLDQRPDIPLQPLKCR